MAISPLISNGSLSLNAAGDLATDMDIVTQMAVGLTAYNCVYDRTINSGLIPYLKNSLITSKAQTTLKNIIVSAYQSMITAKIISGLQIAIQAQTISTIYINLSAIDDQGNQVSINWIN